MNAADYYKANVGLVHSVSRKGFGRLQAARVGIDYDDVFQEMSVVFLKAYERFNPELGFQFSTFYFRSAYNRLNGWAQDMIDERIKLGITSIEDLSPEGDGSMEEVLYEDGETPEGALHAKQVLAQIEQALSPLAALILAWSVTPPDEVMGQIRAAELHAEFGRSLGFDSRCMVTLSPRYVGAFLTMISDVTRPEVDRALREINTLRYRGIKQFTGA